MRIALPAPRAGRRLEALVYKMKRSASVTLTLMVTIAGARGQQPVPVNPCDPATYNPKLCPSHPYSYGQTPYRTAPCERRSAHGGFGSTGARVGGGSNAGS
jgi:hypothetical protein